MATCTLSVETVDGRTTFRPGETIQGRVTVTVEKETRPRRLVVTYIWRTHGRGNTDQGQFERKDFEDLHWLPGQSYTYDFHFTVQPLPLTYRGHYLQVEQLVEARADLAWRLDSKAALEFVVQPNHASRHAYLARPYPLNALGRANQTPPAALRWFLYIVLGPLVAAAIVVFAALVHLIFGVVHLWRALVRQKTGEVQVDLGLPQVAPVGQSELILKFLPRDLRRDKTWVVSPGEDIRLSLRFKPRGELRVNEISATLKGLESVTRGLGTNSRTYLHTIAEQRVRLAGETTYRQGHMAWVEGTLRVPDVDAWSFDARSNRVQWSIDLRIDIPGWPDWRRTVPIVLAPPEE